MRLTIHGTAKDVEVVADLVSIPGTAEEFAVHPAIERLFHLDEDIQPWTVTHIATNFVVGRGESIDAAVTCACLRWASKSPEEIAEAIKKARVRYNHMIAERAK